MPSGTKLQRFIDDLREGKSNVCRAFDDLFGTPGAIGEWKSAAGNVLKNHRNDLQNKNFWPNQLTAPGGGWAIHELMGTAPAGSHRVKNEHNLKKEDIDHITAWPADQMDLIRTTVDEAIGPPGVVGRPVQFWWKLWDGGRSEIEISRQSGGAIWITFLTPRSKVTYPPNSTAPDEVDIEV